MMTSRRCLDRIALALFALFAFGVAACGSSETATTTVPGAHPGVTTPDEDLLSGAVQRIPILREINAAPSQGLQDLLDQSSGFVVGRISAVTLGDEQVLDSMPVECESADGVPAEGRCSSELRTVALELSLDIESAAWASEPGTSSGSSLVLTVPFATLAQPIEASRTQAREAATAFAAAAENQRVAAFVSHSEEYGPLLASAVSLAAVSSDDRIVPAPFDASESEVGIGEAATLEDLRAAVAASGRFRETA